MRPEHNFTPQRIIARHCAELLPARKAAFDYVDAGQDIGKAIANEAGSYIGPAIGSAGLKVMCANTAKTSTTAYNNRMGKGFAHCVVDLAGFANFLVSIDIADALILTDRAYGGEGEVPDVLPEELPLSADLSLRQIENACCDAIIKTFSGAFLATVPDMEMPLGKIARRGRDMSKLDPFRGKPECVEFALVVDEAGHDPWKICIAAGLQDIHKLSQLALLALEEPAAAPVPNDPMAQPFCDVELPAQAVLSEMQISLARLAKLNEGDIIPLAIYRKVPIRIGDLTIAYGQVGAKDDRIALQIGSSQ